MGRSPGTVDHSGHSPLGRHGIDEFVAVKAIAAQGHEQLFGLNGTRVGAH